MQTPKYCTEITAFYQLMIYLFFWLSVHNSFNLFPLSENVENVVLIALEKDFYKIF